MNFLVSNEIEKNEDVNIILKHAIDKIPNDVLLQKIEIDRDRKSNHFKITIIPYCEDVNIEIPGFKTIINGVCKTCLNYGGAFTHDFIRGTIGRCFLDNNDYAPWHVCSDYENKKEVFEECRKEQEAFEKKQLEQEIKRKENILNEVPELKHQLEDIKDKLLDIKKTMQDELS